jgi:hypothetical protein
MADSRMSPADDMTPTELLAAGAALCHLAAANARTNGPERSSAKDRQTMASLARQSYQLLLSTGMTPTELKDLGLRLVERGGLAQSSGKKDRQ